MFPLGIDFHQRDIIALIRADKFCGVARLIAKHHFDGLCAFDDVKVGEDIAARINHEAGARAFHGNRVHKKIVFSSFGENIRDCRRGLAVNAHVDGFIVSQRSVALLDGLRIACAARHGFDAGGLARGESCPGPKGAENQH